MHDFDTLLAVGPSGPACRDPLKEFGFRFEPKTGSWRRVVRFHEKMPAKTTRGAVAAECGIPEALLERWESSARDAGEGAKIGAAELLAVKAGGLVDLDPLARWGFRFYPRSGVWRRTRADRNEVDRAVVARKVGVDAEIIAAWEGAACAQSSDDG